MWNLMSPVFTDMKNAIPKTTRQTTAMASSFSPSKMNTQSRAERLRDEVGAFIKSGARPNYSGFSSLT